MRWYRAEIRGEGFMLDSGHPIPEEKVVYYDFEEESDELAIEEARRFAHDSSIAREFLLTDPDPQVTVLAFVGNHPSVKCARLVN